MGNSRKQTRDVMSFLWSKLWLGTLQVKQIPLSIDVGGQDPLGFYSSIFFNKNLYLHHVTKTNGLLKQLTGYSRVSTTGGLWEEPPQNSGDLPSFETKDSWEHYTFPPLELCPASPKWTKTTPCGSVRVEKNGRKTWSTLRGKFQPCLCQGDSPGLLWM